MYKIILVTKLSVIVVLLSLLSSVTAVHAQEDLGLCPDGFDQGVVSTGFVECYRRSSARSDRSDAELLRLQREAVCLATPNAAVTNSFIRTDRSGRFFAEITCTISRQVPEGTVFCLDDSEEVFRAFNTLVCKYYGSSVASMQQGITVVNTQTSECATTNGGRVLRSSIMEEEFEGAQFFRTTLACATDVDPTNIFECPFGYTEISRDENLITCDFHQESFDTIEEAQAANQEIQSICTDTTDGLGTVTDFIAGASSGDKFISSATCEVRIARYGDFADQSILRACDATCTESVQQARACLNGGTIGASGCIEPSTQIIERRCNTGPDRDGLCPLMATPATSIIPLLLLEDD